MKKLIRDEVLDQNKTYVIGDQIPVNKNKKKEIPNKKINQKNRINQIKKINLIDKKIATNKNN